MTDSEFDKLKKSSSSGVHGSMSAADKSDEASAKASANLADELQYEKDARREERFMFVAALMVVVNAFIFMHMQTWSAPIVIGLVELILLTVYARHCGINEVVQLLDYALATPRKIRQMKRRRFGTRR
nr:hypothetical protein [Alcaligenes faecalis]